MCQVTWMFDDVIICFQAIQLRNYYLTTSWPQVAGLNTKLTMLLVFDCHFWEISPCRPKTLMSFYDFFSRQNLGQSKGSKIEDGEETTPKPTPKCDPKMWGFLSRRSHGFCSWNQYETLEAEWSVGTLEVDVSRYLRIQPCDILRDFLGCQPGYKLIPEADVLLLSPICWRQLRS